MTKKLKNKLVNALKKAGMSEVLVDAFEEQDDTQVQKFIDKISQEAEELPTMEEIIESDAFEKLIEEKGLDFILSKSKKTQSAFDKKINKALSTYRKTILGKGDEDDDDDEDETPTSKKSSKKSKSDDDDDMPAWAKKLMDKVDNLEQSKNQETNEQKGLAAFKKTDLPDALQKKWVKRLDFDSDVSLDDQVKDLVEEFEAFGGKTDTNYRFDQRQRADETLSKKDEEKLGSLAEKL